MASLNDLINGTFKSLPSTVQPNNPNGMLGRGLPYSADQLAPTWTPSPAAISSYAPTYSPVADYNGASTAIEDALIAQGVKAGIPMAQQQGGSAVPSSLPGTLPGMVAGATPVPRAEAGSPTSSGQGGLFDMLGALFGSTKAGGLLKSLSPDTFYGIGEALKGNGSGLASMFPGGGGGFSDSGLIGLLNGRPAGSTETTTSWGASKVGPGGESWAAGPRPSGSSGGGDSLMSNQSGPAPTREQYLAWKASQSPGTGLNPQQLVASLARNRS